MLSDEVCTKHTSGLLNYGNIVLTIWEDLMKKETSKTFKPKYICQSLGSDCGNGQYQAGTM